MAIVTAEKRTPGMSEAERAELQRSLIAYTGTYRVEGSEFVTSVDVSWNGAWNGTEQRRHFQIQGDKLTIDTAPGPSVRDPGKTVFGRLVFHRDE